MWIAGLDQWTAGERWEDKEKKGKREKSVQSIEAPCLKLDTTECRRGKFELASLQQERLCFYSNPMFWTETRKNQRWLRHQGLLELMDWQSSRVVIWIPLWIYCSSVPLLVIIFPAITPSSSAVLSQATNRWLSVLWYHNSNMITVGGSDNSTTDSVCLYLSSFGHMALMLKITLRGGSILTLSLD